VAGPWEKYGGSGPVYGAPRLPPAQTAPQAQQDVLQAQHLGQQIEAQPLQNENTRVNIAQGQTSIQNQHFNQNQGLRQEFNNLPEVKNYSDAISSLAGAMKAPDNAQGDLAVVYSFAKAMDPGSVVREGEMDMANATASQVQQVNQMVQAITAGKRLPPAVRVHLIDAARQKIAGLRAPYDQQYQRYSELAHANGFNPQEIVGSPLYKSVEPIEEQYIRSHGGTPRDPNAPLNVQSSQYSEGGFGLQQDPRNTSLSPEQAAAYDAWWKANPNPSPRQLLQFGSTIGLNIPPKNAAAIITAKKRGSGISHDVQVLPDISDVRGGNNTSGQDSINAVARGVGDSVSVGALDKAVALGDTVFKGGTFDQNLGRQYAISDYDQQNHPLMRLGGQALGGAALPMGEVSSVGNVAAKGAAYGGAYGLNSSRQLSDVPANVLGGAAVGAAVPAVLGKVFKPKAGR
jgi:hypothetical protein